MATGTPGKILTYGDPPVIVFGMIAPPEWPANMTANINRWIDGNGASLKSLQVDNGGATGPGVAGHIVLGGPTPSISVLGGAGTGATAQISGSDACGSITVQTGTGTPASQPFVLVTFANQYTNAPRVQLTINGGVITGVTNWSVTSTVSGFTVQAIGTPTASATSYQLTYLCMG